jgi:hypothetical protein
MVKIRPPDAHDKCLRAYPSNLYNFYELYEFRSTSVFPLYCTTLLAQQQKMKEKWRCHFSTIYVISNGSAL